MRALLERGHLAHARFMKYFSRLFIAKIITPRTLPHGEYSDCGCGEFRHEREHLETGDETVSSKQCHEPRKPGSRQGFSRRIRREEPQCRQVDQRTFVDFLQIAPGRMQLGRTGHPTLQAHPDIGSWSI